MLWEAALPPCICAIAACAVYVTMVRVGTIHSCQAIALLTRWCMQRSENLWDVFLQSIIGKLYVISLFVIL